MLKRFHKQFLIFFAVSSLIILSSVNLAVDKNNPNEGTVHDVYPWTPLAEIQATVDSAADGDTIYFNAGTYDWSSAPTFDRAINIGTINIIDKTLTIKGEDGTILVGPASVGTVGANAFYVKNLATDKDVTFDGLIFQTFRRGVTSHYISNYPHPPWVDDISIPNLRNLTVKNCIFSDIHLDAISIGYIGGNVLIQNNDMSAARMGLFLSWYWSEGKLAWQPEDTYIRFLENNVVAGSYGLGTWQTTNVIIKQNIIESGSTGISMGYTRNGAVISDNSLFNCFYGISIYGRWRSGVEFEAEGAVVENNELVDIQGYGMRFYGDACYGHTVSKNEIHMMPGSRTGVYTLAHDSYYGQNKISGSGRYAFVLDWWNYIPGGGFIVYAHHETLQANNVNQFLPIFSHFYLHYLTHNNLVVGSGMGHNTYLDYGTNNRITGARPMAGGIGQDLSEAIKERNEELKDAKKNEF
jgi:hypothetical protein